MILVTIVAEFNTGSAALVTIVKVAVPSNPDAITLAALPVTLALDI